MLAALASPGLGSSSTGLTLTPASISLKGPSGTSYTQSITIKNFTTAPMVFHLEAEDVVIENGKRTFVPAGRIADGAAQFVSYSREPFRLQPGEEFSTPVTWILPPAGGTRGVAVFFVGEPFSDNNGIKVRVRLGAVVDFTVSEGTSVEFAEPVVTLPSPSQNASVTQALVNTGNEPVIAKGVAAIVDDAGKLVGKASFAQRRLFPGERDTLRAEYPGALSSGRYRVLCTVSFAGKSSTRTAELVIP